MKIRAAIFDVYGTLLEVRPPPPDADARWEKLFHDSFNAPPSIRRLDFSVACSRAIARRHTDSKALGIAFPEIVWPSIVTEVLPAFARLPPGAKEEFIYQQIQIGHSIRFHPGADRGLRLLADKGCVLGIASNAQHYTLRELGEALSGAGLDLSRFDRDLCVWSFEQGFSKPNPHVFQIVTTRLELRGVSPAETLVVGDRLDNDIEPARTYGMQTWHLTSSSSIAPKSGNWEALTKWLQHGGSRCNW